MDQPVAPGAVSFRGASVWIPMPLMVVIEDVGWWQGADGSTENQPFRNRLDRRHCLADYEALARLAETLGTRLVLGMVMGEWDRTGFLKDIPGATWMGRAWDNRENIGPWLDEAAAFLNSRLQLFELALHGVGHEFWQEGQMARTEFHDSRGFMRDPLVVTRHLAAFFSLLRQHRLNAVPKIFIPPALNHSFGDQTVQPLLRRFGIELVVTRFARARTVREPDNPCLAWESGVVLLERGLSPVPWHRSCADPVRPAAGQCVLPLHWSNLLHEDPGRNASVVDPWAGMIRDLVKDPGLMLARDAVQCLHQAFAFFLGRLSLRGKKLVIDLSGLPDLPRARGEFYVRIRGGWGFHCRGGAIATVDQEADGVLRLCILPDPTASAVILE